MHIVRWLLPFCNGLGLGVIAMLLHEGGHLAAALALGIRVRKIGMKWNKGLYTVRASGSASQNLIIAIAGPAVNLALIAAGAWVPLFGMANFCYAMANMLPIEGSDGFRVAACLRQIRQERLAG